MTDSAMGYGKQGQGQSAKSKGERDDIRGCWDEVLQDIGTRQISTFLRHMWVSKYGDVKAQSLYREIKQRLVDESVSSLKFAKLCASESGRYVAILDQDKGVLKGAEPSVRAIVKSLSADIALPALLSGLMCLSDLDFEKLCRLLLAIVLRHSVIADLNQAELEEALYEIARALRSDIEGAVSSGKALNKARSALKAIDPSKKQLAEGIVKLHLKKPQAAYIVREIARRAQTSGKSLNFDRVSIEHIFPESADKKNWPNKAALEPYIWHIGNLLILEPKLNRDAGGKPYAEKLQIFGKSEIKDAKDMAIKFVAWNVDSLVKRSQLMIPAVESIWNLN